MEIGLSHETLAMIEERLGPEWAKRALWGVTLAIIISPILIILTLGTLSIALFLAILGWTVNELSEVLGLVLTASVVSSLFSFALYRLALALLKAPLEKRWEESRAENKALLGEAKGVLDEARVVSDDLGELAREVEELAKETKEINELTRRTLESAKRRVPDTEELPPQ